MTEIRFPPTHTERHASPEAHSTVNVAGSTLLMGVFAFTCVAALCFSIYAIGRADAAGERARLAERETRIMQDDLKYIRAYASARGMFIPSDHDEAEEYPRGTQNHHQRPEHTLASATGHRAQRDEPDGVLVRR